MTPRSDVPVGICILGCGGVARAHAAAIRRLGGKARLCFASRSAEKAEQYRRRHGGEAAFGSYEEALADPRVQAAVICTPHDLHLEHARLASSHGVHVLLEKPIGRTLEEADEVIRAGESMDMTASLTLDLHDQQIALFAEMIVARLGGHRLMVSSRKPVIVNAASVDLVNGIEALREIANLPSISKAVPVSFVLTFDED